MKIITVKQLNERIKNGDDIQIIDVRETYEYEAANIGALLIPKDTVQDRIAEIAKDKDVIVHCRSGVRSAGVIGYLEHHHGYTNLYNLEGGILAWAEEIDPSVNK